MTGEPDTHWPEEGKDAAVELTAEESATRIADLEAELSDAYELLGAPAQAAPVEQYAAEAEAEGIDAELYREMVAKGKP